MKRSGFKRKPPRPHGMADDHPDVRKYAALPKPRKPMRQGKGLKPVSDAQRKRQALNRAAEQATMPTSDWRREVWALCRGVCVMCGKQVPRDANMWTWQAHHAIPKQVLRARGLRGAVNDPRLSVVLCARCHERHETAAVRVPGARIPRYVHAAVAELGLWAVDRLARYHPAAGFSGNDEGGPSA